VTDLADALDRLPQQLPRPAGGETSSRFRALWDVAVESPSLGRLAEAHFDAIAILQEGGREPVAGARYGVWAAGGPDPATLERTSSGWRLTGTKHWCSGASIATHALVTARDGDSNALVAVDLRRGGVSLQPPTWTSPAFTAIDTRTVRFDLDVDEGDIVGTDDWYLRRPGFWHGAVGVAACWAGCSAGLIRELLPKWPQDPHALAHLGAIDSDVWTMQALLDRAAAEIDDANDRPDDGRRRALRVRHAVDALVADITVRAQRAVGPGPFAHRDDLHVRLAETDLYRRQCHAERDLEQLGRSATDVASW
jgi:alkylation response protein AidB-like acyl-CoA dehydrogenase